MSFSICIKCGEPKKKAISTCLKCGYTPQTDEEKAKSIIMSLDYEIDGEYLGKSKAELLAIGESIRKKEYEFDEQEVQRVIETVQQILSISPKVLIKEFIGWIAVPLLFIVSLYFFLWIAKR